VKIYSMTHPKGTLFHPRHKSHVYHEYTVMDCICVAWTDERERAQVVKESKRQTQHPQTQCEAFYASAHTNAKRSARVQVRASAARVG